MKGGVPIATLLSLILSRCAVGLPSQVGKGLQRCDAPDAESCIMSDNSGQGIQTKPPASEPAPLVGLALSGGGSKSAPFVMGVLKRFVDNDWYTTPTISHPCRAGPIPQCTCITAHIARCLTGSLPLRAIPVSAAISLMSAP